MYTNINGVRKLVVDNSGLLPTTSDINSFNTTSGMAWVVDNSTSFEFDEIKLLGNAHLAFLSYNIS